MASFSSSMKTLDVKEEIEMKRDRDRQIRRVREKERDKENMQNLSLSYFADLWTHNICFPFKFFKNWKSPVILVVSAHLRVKKK